MGNRRMIRARSDCGAALVLLDLDTLQQALAHLLRHDPSQGYLVVRLAVENAPVQVVAAETGLDPVQQVAAARAAQRGSRRARGSGGPGGPEIGQVHGLTAEIGERERRSQIADGEARRRAGTAAIMQRHAMFAC